MLHEESRRTGSLLHRFGNTLSETTKTMKNQSKQTPAQKGSHTKPPRGNITVQTNLQPQTAKGDRAPGKRKAQPATGSSKNPQHHVNKTNNRNRKLAGPLFETTEPPIRSELEFENPVATRWTSESTEKAKAKILEGVSGWLESRIDDVFEMADQCDDKIIDWADLSEVRMQICGCVAEDLNHQLGRAVELVLENELIMSAESAIVVRHGQ